MKSHILKVIDFMGTMILAYVLLLTLLFFMLFYCTDYVLNYKRYKREEKQRMWETLKK